jgi:predicted dehydrogenase
MLRVGIVGSGVMGTTHAFAWAKTPAQVVGIYSKDVDRAKENASKLGARFFDSLDPLLDACDVIDVCVPTHLHHEIVVQAARAGKHMICEKPLARTYAQGLEMVEACHKAGVKLLVAHVVRFFPEYAAAKNAVQRGDVGQVAVVRLTRCSFQPRVINDNWFVDFAKSGGMVLDLMIHDFDYARWVAGDVETVFARSVRGVDPSASEDYGVAILRHTNGALSNVEGGWAYPPPMFRTGFEIAGDAGLIENPPDSAVPLGVYLKQVGQSDIPDVGIPGSPLAEDPYTTEIKHFYSVLTEGVEPRVTAEDGLAALRIALAALQSAQTGRVVRVQEVN